MGKDTAISWTDHTFNPWIGCAKVSPGCANCYAEKSTRARVLRAAGQETWGKGAQRSKTQTWGDPLKWNRDAEFFGECPSCGHRGHSPDGCPRCGVDMVPARPRVFCASLADWLDNEVPIEWLADLLSLIQRTPNLDWLLLTKRPENWKSRLEAVRDRQRESLTVGILLASGWLANCAPDNVWIGTTVENQEMADKRIPELLKIPAKVRFLSCEPLLGPVDLRLERLRANGYGVPVGPVLGRNGQLKWTGEGAPMIHWVICGGESGPGFREFNPDWARSLRDQCKAAHVAFHMKQMGGLKPSMMPPIPDDLAIREWPKGGAL